MKITFGHVLDGTQLRGVDDSMGDIVCGPLRLVEILETQLGLKRKAVAEMTRIFQLVKVLEKLVGKKQSFYSLSFEKDPLAVSETLLGWRDSLVLAGWDGMAEGNSQRLHDLAEINAALKEEVAPGLPDRIAAIYESLSYRDHCVESIVVVDTLSSFPHLWRKILKK